MKILEGIAKNLREKNIARIKELTELAENPTEENPFKETASDLLEHSIYLYILSDTKLFGE